MSENKKTQSDFIVPGMSNRRLAELASALRRANGLVGRAIDILSCLTSGWIVTIDPARSKKRLIVEVLSDSEMGSDDGLTTVEKERVVIRFKESVWTAAQAGNGRARFTLCHEYSHAVLNHHKAPNMARATGVTQGTSRPTFISTYESAEHQANYVAAATLVDPALVTDGATVESVANDFQVSIAVAEIVLQARQTHTKSLSVLEGLKKLSETLSGRVSLRVPTKEVEEKAKGSDGIESVDTDSFATKLASNDPAVDICAECGKVHAVQSIGGNKSVCEESRRAGNFYQDGDDPWEVEF